MAAAWSPDFCLVCDQQTFGEAYCSQACRLAELDQFSLDAASNYSAASSRRSSTNPVSDDYAPSFSSRSSALPTSSSPSSLSSLRSSGTQPSSQSNSIPHELRDYTSCFDRVRDWKRRIASQ